MLQSQVGREKTKDFSCRSHPRMRLRQPDPEDFRVIVVNNCPFHACSKQQLTACPGDAERFYRSTDNGPGESGQVMHLGRTRRTAAGFVSAPRKAEGHAAVRRWRANIARGVAKIYEKQRTGDFATENDRPRECKKMHDITST